MLNFFKFNQQKHDIYKIIFFLLLFCSLSLNSFLKAHDPNISLTIQEKIDLITPADRLILETFFRNLFSNGDFALALFGNKPLGSIDVVISEEFFNKQVINNFLGWKTWQKYKGLFVGSKFELLYYDQIKLNSFFGFNLINKNRCHEVIADHIDLFRSCFSFNNVDELIEQFCSKGIYSNTLEYRKKNFYACLGILFGYGEKSAIQFERRMHSIRLLAQCPFDLSGLNQSDITSVCHLDKSVLENYPCYIPIHEMIEELNKLEDQKIFACASKHNDSLYPIKINGFMTFGNDPDIEIIQSTNDALREKLVEILYSDNFLKIVLDRLSE